MSLEIKNFAPYHSLCYILFFMNNNDKIIKISPEPKKNLIIENIRNFKHCHKFAGCPRRGGNAETLNENIF